MLLRPEPSRWHSYVPHSALAFDGTLGISAAVNRSLVDFSLHQLEQQLAAWGMKPSHAARVLRSFYEQSGADPSVDSGGERPTVLAIAPQSSRGFRLSEDLIERVRTQIPPTLTTIATRQVSTDGTTKLLLRFGDGRSVEAVLMPGFRGDRTAGCVSSQVGCAMRCDFCATTRNGFERNLTAGEIVEQFLALRREANGAGRKLQTLVFMGMGEPLLNLDAVLEAIDRIADNRIGGFGWRQVTVSTVGIVPGIEALTATDLNINLAVSLHAPDDATRAELIPTSKGFPISDIIAAAERFQKSRGRPAIVQYCLLKGVNDSLAHARELAAVLGGARMHVNLLRYNPTGLSLRGRSYETSDEETAAAFVAELRSRGVVAHFRLSRGPDIDAACGQLRAKGLETEG